MKISRLLVMGAVCVTLSLSMSMAAEPSVVARHHSGYSTGTAAGTSYCGHVHDETCGYLAGHAAIACDSYCVDLDGDGYVDHHDGCSYSPAVAGSACQHQHTTGGCGSYTYGSQNGTTYGHHGRRSGSCHR